MGKLISKVIDYKVYKDDKLVEMKLSEKEKEFLPEKVKISTKENLLKYVQERSLSITIEIFQCLIGVIYVCNYIFYSYLVYNSSKPNIILLITYLCIDIGIFFSSMLLYCLKSKELKNKFFFWIDLIILPISIALIATDVISTFILFSSPNPAILLYYGRQYYFYGIIMFFRLLPSLSVVKHLIKGMSYGALQQMSLSSMLIFSLICIGALIIQITQNEYGGEVNKVSFDKCLFIVVTVSQLQEFSEITFWLGKLFLAVSQFLAVIIILQQASVFIYSIKKQGKKFVQKKGFMKKKIKDHVIVDASAGIKIKEISDFLKEFFDASHGKTKNSNVFLNLDDSLKDEEIENWTDLISHRYFSQRVKITQGNIMDYDFLTYLNVIECHGVFLLCDNSVENGFASDTIQLSKLVAIKNLSSDTDVYCHIIEPDNRLLFLQADAKVVVCTKDLKTKVLGRSLVAPGLPTLLANLNYSSTFGVDDKSAPLWLKEYCAGAAQELYNVPLSVSFVTRKKSFIEASDELFQTYGICLLGLYDKDEKIKINPRYEVKDDFGNKTLKSQLIETGDRGIVIAQDVFHAHLCAVHKLRPEIIPYGMSLKKRKWKKFKKNKVLTETQVIEVKKPKELQNRMFHSPQKKDKNKLSDKDDIPLRPPRTPTRRGYLTTEFEYARLFESPCKVFSMDNIQEEYQKTVVKEEDLEIMMKHLVPQTYLQELSKTISKSGYSVNKEKAYFEEARNQFSFKPTPISQIEKENEDRLGMVRFKIPNDEVKDLEEKLRNHIVIMGNLEEALTIVLMLRSKTFADDFLTGNKRKKVVNLRKTIVLLGHDHDGHLCGELYDMMRFFEDVFFYEGDCTDPIALKNVRLMKAYSVLYLRPDNDKCKSGNITILDGDCVRTRLSISGVARNIRKVSEVVFRRNIKFFNDFTFENVLVNQVYLDNPIDNEFEKRYLLSTPVVSGSVFSQSFMLRILCQSYYNKGIVDIIETLTGFDYNFKTSSTINLYPIPDLFIGKQFKDLYRYYLYKKGTTIVGLYRKHTEDDENANSLDINQSVTSSFESPSFVSTKTDVFNVNAMNNPVIQLNDKKIDADAPDYEEIEINEKTDKILFPEPKSSVEKEKEEKKKILNEKKELEEQIKKMESKFRANSKKDLKKTPDSKKNNTNKGGQKSTEKKRKSVDSGTSPLQVQKNDINRKRKSINVLPSHHTKKSVKIGVVKNLTGQDNTKNKKKTLKSYASKPKIDVKSRRRNSVISNDRKRNSVTSTTNRKRGSIAGSTNKKRGSNPANNLRKRKKNTTYDKPWLQNAKQIERQIPKIKPKNLRRRRRRRKKTAQFKRSFEDEEAHFEGFYYVFTFPKGDTIIQKDDHMYAIGDYRELQQTLSKNDITKFFQILKTEKIYNKKDTVITIDKKKKE